MNCTVHHNCHMAVKKWIQTFCTHPTFFTELGSPWLEYTPVKLGPFVGSTSLMTGKKQRKQERKKPTKNNNTWSGFVVMSHIHTVIHQRSAHGHRSSSPYISCKTKKINRTVSLQLASRWRAFLAFYSIYTCFIYTIKNFCSNKIFIK